MVSGKDIEAEDLKIIGEEVGNRLKAARKAEGISQVDLAKKSKINKSILSKIENGKRIYSIKQVKKIAKVLKVTPQYLIAG